jgi:hypothetical protein
MVGRETGGPRPTKDMVLRLDPELAARLRLVADVEGRSISDVAREAIATLVERRRRDKRFRRLLEESLARHQQAIRLLGDDAEPEEGAQRGGVA